MKTIISTIAAVLLTSVLMAAEPITPGLAVIHQKEAGVFKVIYAGGTSSSVVLKLYAPNGEIVFAEKVNSTKGFSRPLNFTGMNFGEYTIEVNDGIETKKLSVNYSAAESRVEEATNLNAYVAKVSDDRKYLLSISNELEEQISFKIYDAEKNLIHNESMTIKGNKGLVYNLNTVSGELTFVVSSKSGATKRFQY
jgi:hypothetical protein